MIRAFLTSFILTSILIFTAHNLNEVNKSLDRSEQILKEIKQAKEKLNYYKF